MYSNNPLVLSIFSTLKNTDKEVSLYQLIKILEKSGYDLANKKSDESQQLKLFRKNFLVMNALYQLQLDLCGSGCTVLISSLAIQIVIDNSVNEELLPIEMAERQLTDQALSKYYLNWDNYHSANSAVVDDLLRSFWTRFNQLNLMSNETDKRLDSLQVLGLESSASWEDVQQSYRQLITVYHPDKGGNSLKFIQVREAYLILKLTNVMSQ